MENRPAVVEVSNLVIRLPARADRENAVDGVGFAVQPREILCLVGESGSGKSVLAQAIMGLLPVKELTPIAGQVRLAGENILSASQARLRQLRGQTMSMIFQEPMTALNPVMTVGRQIEEVIRIHSDLPARARRRRVLDIMHDVRLPEPEQLHSAYPHQLSGGQRQRVMIAAALVLEPKLLIADEPTTALDVTTQAQILRIIKRIQSTHDTAVLFITHDIGVVSEIADRVAVMNQGRLVEIGDVEQVLGHPKETYTKTLIAAVPCLIPRARPRSLQAPTVLSIKNLTKTYKTTSFFGGRRDVNAVKGVNLTIRRGEVLGVVGESGSGKSTIARTVVRLVEPSEGQIHLGEVDVSAATGMTLHHCRKRMQIVFQDPYRSLNPRRTVLQSMVEGPMNYGVTLAEARQVACELLALVGIESDSMNRYPHQFSGGQRQRICLARALAMQPELLVADEIVSALDVSVQAQVLALLDDIRARFNLAILFITHDLRVAAQVCDSIAVMFDGSIVEHGPTTEIFANPTHDYTRALFDAVPGRTRAFGAERAIASRATSGEDLSHGRSPRSTNGRVVGHG